MVNIKYPVAMKNKAILAWITAATCGFLNFYYFWPVYMALENHTGNPGRNKDNERKYIIKKLVSHLARKRQTPHRIDGDTTQQTPSD